MTTPGQAVSYVIACVIPHNLGIQKGDTVDKAEHPFDVFNPTAHQVGCNSQEGVRWGITLHKHTLDKSMYSYIYLVIDKWFMNI